MAQTLKDIILHVLKTKPNRSCKISDLAQATGQKNDNTFYSLLMILQRNGLVNINASSGVVSMVDLSGAIEGVFRGNRRGFGFVTPDGCEDKDDDIFIPINNIGGAMDGDRVLCKIDGQYVRQGKKSDDKTEGKVLGIVERAHKTIIGKVEERNIGTRRNIRSVFYIVPDDEKISCDFFVDGAEKGVVAHSGDKVEARITAYPFGGRGARAIVVNNLGKADSKEANYKSILIQNDIKQIFPEEVIEEAEKLAAEEPKLTRERLDLSELAILTIDGADSKDLDDAISLEKLEDGWKLGVHIADVSNYVRPNTPLDHEAFERGTSVYFTDQVVPMLPVALSNGICSLNPGVPRYAMTAFITLDSKGEIKSTTIHNSYIVSKVRGVYSEVNDIMANGENSEFAEKYAPVWDDLADMFELYKVLAKKSKAHGALELETSEPIILLDDDGIPYDIVKRERGEAERMIEQFMLAANEGVATYLYEHDAPCVYRIHEEPNPEKIADFARYAHNIGLPTGNMRSGFTDSKDLQKTLEAAKERGMGEAISNIALRSLQKARYSATQGGHYGLAIGKYCHFTSPIRRYPDLAVHRICKEVIAGNDAEYLAPFADKAARHSSDNELNAINAERAIDDLYKCMYMSTHLGEVHEGTISSVTSFGFFVELDNTCEGLVSIRSLDGFYNYDERTLSLSRGRNIYRIGDRVKIKVERADIITGNVDFSLA